MSAGQSMQETSVLYQIFECRFGGLFDAQDAEKSDMFLRDLLDYRNVLRRSLRPCIASAAIRKWLVPSGNPPRANSPKREQALVFLHDYLLWINRRGLVAEGFKGKFTALQISLAPYGDAKQLPSRPPQLSGQVNDQPPPSRINIDPAVDAMLKTMVSASIKNKHSERDDFFRGGEPEDSGDRSYFLMYRYSTISDSVLKTFVKINPPKDVGAGVYTFNHFIWGDRDQDSKTFHIFRECEGVIIKLDASYYFIGSNYIVPVNKRLDPSKYKRVRHTHRQRPNGIGLTAFEYESISLSPGLISGITMTLAAHHQPVIARTALLHLGTKSSLGYEITDEHIEPAVLASDDVAEDLKVLIARLKALGVKLFSEYLQILVTKKDWEEAGHLRLAAAIKKLMNNNPAQSQSGGKGKTLHIQSAIETIGEGRPRG